VHFPPYSLNHFCKEHSDSIVWKRIMPSNAGVIRLILIIRNILNVQG
jgi:hypothetical protein